MKRYVKNVFSLVVILCVGALAYFSYDSYGKVDTHGETLAGRMQSIALTAIDNSNGRVVVQYRASRDSGGRIQPFFVIAPAPNILCEGIVSQEQEMQLQTERNSAVVTVLRLTTREVLPLDPSIRIVLVQLVDVCGQSQAWQALADSLKGLPQDAADVAWFERLTRV